MARRYFGTDGVRGIVGEGLTLELVERLGRAATVWAGGGASLIGRDTRGSGPQLEKAFAQGVVSGGGTAVLAGVLPTPAVALQALDLGVVISASHNPPEYNGVKFFDRGGRKLPDSTEEQIEELLDAGGTGGGAVERVEGATDRYLEHVLGHFGSDLTGLRVGLDCANGALSDIAPVAFERLGAEVTVVAAEPDGSNINDGCGATDLALLQRTVTAGRLDLGLAFDGDGDRMLAVDADGAEVDGDGIIAVLAVDLDVDVVAVTEMTNLGFHRLMEERGVRVVTTPVGDRYVLEALHREGGVLGGEQSGHIIYLHNHVTGDGLAAGLLLCAALHGRSLADVAAVMPRFPQVKENLRLPRTQLTAALRDELQRLNEQLDGSARVLVRSSGTEPVVRLLAEAETREEAQELCVRIRALVHGELG